MRSKHRKTVLKSLSFKALTMLNDPRVQKRINGIFKISFKNDIPYIAGYSKDGKTFYVDRHFNPKFGKINTLPYLLIHEKTEKALMDIFNLKYQEAHHIALYSEKKTVVADGINWEKYNNYFKLYEKPLGHEKLIYVPKDLDLRPYHDEKNPEFKKLVAKIKTE